MSSQKKSAAECRHITINCRLILPSHAHVQGNHCSITVIRKKARKNLFRKYVGLDFKRGDKEEKEKKATCMFNKVKLKMKFRFSYGSGIVIVTKISNYNNFLIN